MFKRPLIALGLALASTAAAAQDAQYFVSITNITPGQTFTPQLVMTHDTSFQVFRYGKPASEGLEILAEGGDTSALVDEAGDSVWEAVTIDGLLGPGETATTMISAEEGGFLSVAAMLIPTNDTFVALSRTRLPRAGGWSRLLRAYDSGTEANDQDCANIPGPRCGGEGVSAPADDDEGFVYIGNGFHDLGEMSDSGSEVLGPHTYDWRNPVARVVVRRVN